VAMPEGVVPMVDAMVAMVEGVAETVEAVVPVGEVR
jgi:hypothetical protein